MFDLVICLHENMLMNYLSNNATLMVVSSCLWLSACVYAPPHGSRPDRPFHENKNIQNLEAAKFNKEFALAVIEADSIVVTEHSHPSDLDNSLLATRVDIPKYIYKQKKLNFNERTTFVKDVQKLKGRVRSTTRCIFVPHHSIELYKGGKPTSVMEICYDCGEIKWNGSQVKASGDMFDAVTPLLKRSGMKVHRDWHSIAEDKFVEGNTTPSENTDVSDVTPNVPEPVLPGQVPTAKWIPGEEGKKVLNPFTGEVVDVEDIPAGLKVRDPNDKNKANIFRVPAL